MALPENVEKLALDAVAGKETTDWIRQHGRKIATGWVVRQPEKGDAGEAQKQALDVVSQCEALRQFRLVAVNRIDAPLPTPNAGVRRSDGSARMAYLWQGSGDNPARGEQGRDNGR
jgi:hypothetical protein